MTAHIIPFPQRGPLHRPLRPRYDTPLFHHNNLSPALSWRWAMAHDAAVRRLLAPMELDAQLPCGRLLLAACHLQAVEFEGGLRLAATSELLWLAKRDDAHDLMTQAVARLGRMGDEGRRAQLWSVWSALRDADLAWFAVKLPLEWALILGEVPIATRQRVFAALWTRHEGAQDWSDRLPMPWRMALPHWLAPHEAV